MWDNFTDDLQAAAHKLEQCLMQFAEFSLAQEQLTKWLKDVERAMTQHTELKSSLQEKRAQLQVICHCLPAISVVKKQRMWFSIAN